MALAMIVVAAISSTPAVARGPGAAPVLASEDAPEAGRDNVDGWSVIN